MSGSAGSGRTRWTFTSFDKSSKASLPHDSVEKLASPYCGSLPYECNPIVPGPMARHAAWPPLVLRAESLGLIVDGECHIIRIHFYQRILPIVGCPGHNISLWLDEGKTTKIFLHPALSGKYSPIGRAARLIQTWHAIPFHAVSVQVMKSVELWSWYYERRYILNCHNNVSPESGRSYPRDIGRSSSIGKDGVIFQFGNTLVHNDVNEYLGDTSSSLALVPQPCTNPTVTSYALDGEGMVPSLIPLRSEEQNEDLYGRKTTLRSSGGVIETGGTDGEVIAGWVFYQKGTECYPDGGEHILHYTGVAKLFFDIPNRRISVMRICKPLELFKGNEPSFGTFSTVKQGKMAYLFGHAPGSTKIMLARVNVTWVLDRSRYYYWDGNKYQGDITKAKHIIDDVEHGAMYRSKLFEPQKGRDWIFIGCSQSGDGKVLLGVSANLEGPYTKFELLNTFSINPTPKDSSRYCIYPHPWAFKEEDGELMITWSEGSTTGGVAAVKVKFVMTMDKGRQTTIMERGIKKGKGRCVIL